MILGVVSDSHGQVAATTAATKLLMDHRVEAVVHCGDIGSTDIIPLFAAWPSHFVFGNVDHDQADLREAIESAGQTCHGEIGRLELEGINICFLHSDDPRAFSDAVSSGDWDLVCYGHTHQAEMHYQGHSLVLNPGAIHRASPRSIAIVELPSLETRHYSIEAP